jgi:hypothetical protein
MTPTSWSQDTSPPGGGQWQIGANTTAGSGRIRVLGLLRGIEGALASR